MKKVVFLTIVVILLAASVAPVAAIGVTCTTIQDGTLTYSAGHYLYPQPLMTGYDPFGYNYEDRIFNGTYANVYLGRAGFPPYEGDSAAYLSANPGAESHWAWPYRDVRLIMKWNDTWLANTDCSGDGNLDRHYGYPTYIGSGAWLTNHQREKNADVNWNYFVKIVAVPSDAIKSGANWYTADGVEIGPVIWGEFATIQEVSNEKGGDHGLVYKSPASPGFGYYQP